MENKVLFNFRIHKELYEYLSNTSKENYTTMTQYLIDIISKDKNGTLNENNTKIKNETDQELYYLRENENYVVSVEDKDDTYFKLSDGSTIPQILFYQTFKQVEKINPDKFFGINKTPVEKMQELGKETLKKRNMPHRQIKIEEIPPEPQVTKGPNIDKN